MCIRDRGDGTTTSLECGLCFASWPVSRATCPSCGSEKVTFYRAEEIPHLEVRACEGCGVYFHQIRLDRAPDAVPDVDELLGLPLDVWARQRGYHKWIPNLIGI